jgi:hypothetical protein
VDVVEEDLEEVVDVEVTEMVVAEEVDAEEAEEDAMIRRKTRLQLGFPSPNSDVLSKKSASKNLRRSIFFPSPSKNSKLLISSLLFKMR